MGYTLDRRGVGVGKYYPIARLPSLVGIDMLPELSVSTVMTPRFLYKSVEVQRGTVLCWSVLCHATLEFGVGRHFGGEAASEAYFFLRHFD